MSRPELLLILAACPLLAYFALRVLLNYMFPRLTDPSSNFTRKRLDPTNHPD
jgi:hypothetical protein